MIMLSFVIVIAVGAALLMLPFATRPGQTTTPLGALFTATSATCVTGLVSYDTYTHWTLFGQLVILLMIQIGGLGFITFGVYGMMLLRRRIGLSDRELIHDSISSPTLGGAQGIVRTAFAGTFIFEGAGAVLLAFRFIPRYGFLKGAYFSLFHAVSAFCNAGFDLMGGEGEFSSFVSRSSDIPLCVTLMILITVGGLGFAVWGDLRENRFRFRRLTLHSKVVLSASLVLTLGGFVFFLVSERSAAFAGMPAGERLVSAAFAAVSPRTAGFNTVDLSAMSGAGKALTMALMFIGGSPGSTAGGIKTTTVAAIFVFIFSYLRRRKSVGVFRRRIDDSVVKKACTVFFVNFSLSLVAIIVITLVQPLPLTDVSFEVFSAVGTVGMTTGITRDLCAVSQLVIIFLMFCGRVGSLTFAASFIDGRKVSDIRYPAEEITVG